MNIDVCSFILLKCFTQKMLICGIIIVLHEDVLYIKSFLRQQRFVGAVIFIIPAGKKEEI